MVTPGRLVSRRSRVSGCPSYFCQLVGPSGPYYRHSMGGISLPITPKTITPLSVPGQIGNAGFRKTGAVDWETLRWRPRRAGVTVGRRECLPLFPRAGGVQPPPPQTCRPRPASARVEGTRAHCSEAGSSPEGRGRGVKSSQPSLPLLGRLRAEAQKPRPAPPHSCTVSLPWALSPCCFSVCLITKQKLPSGLLYFYM